MDTLKKTNDKCLSLSDSQKRSDTNNAPPTFVGPLIIVIFTECYYDALGWSVPLLLTKPRRQGPNKIKRTKLAEDYKYFGLIFRPCVIISSFQKIGQMLETPYAIMIY